MIEILKIINTVSLIYGKFIDEDINKLNQMAHVFSSISNEELQKKCRDREIHIHIKDKPLWSYIIEKIPIIQKKTNDAFIEKLALGVAAFNKCPADLPNNSILYPSQVQAALFLIQPCVLQMDTGEGKTYALLPAAFTLFCKYNKVYVLCANEYLAQRDAIRTKNYWDFVGLDVQFCSQDDSCDDKKWEGDVIYTTLTALMFKGLKDDLNIVLYEKRLSFEAIIIDEIDAVLLDDDSGTYSLIKNIKSNVYNWKTAIDYAQKLEEYDVAINKDNLTASLTISGEEKLKTFLNEHSIPLSQYGQFRKATEISFVALSLEENKDFIFECNTIYSVNRYNGKIEYNNTPDWIVPLEIMRGLNPRTHNISLHTVSPRAFLRQFSHISGMSGTVIEDSAEYLLVYLLPTVVIKPRIERKKGNLQDEVYRDLEYGISAICQKVIEAVEQQRPVLVGTQNIRDAQAIYNSLCGKIKNRKNINIACITGKNDKEIAKIYENGGKVGSIIIATQLVGRGVDIRLSNEAKNNGGLVLLGFERGMDARCDKQFLGRAGRQGDPYTAQFILTLNGTLMQSFSGVNVKKIMDKFGFKDDDVIEHSFVTKSILNAQNRIRENNFYKRRANDFKISTEESIYHNIKNWFNNLNVGNIDDDSKEDIFFQKFIPFVTEHFTKSNLSNIIQDNLNSEQADNIVTNISLSLNIKKTDLVNSICLEGKNKYIVNDIVKDSIYKCIENACSNNNKRKGLLQYLNNSFRYNSIKQRINCINNISNQPNNSNSCNEKFDEIINQINSTGGLQINSASDIKYFYFLLNFIEKNMSTLSDNRYQSIINFINPYINSYWIKRIYDFIKINNRTPYLIAHETIVNAEINYNNFKDGFSHKIANDDLNHLQYYRVLSDGLINEWNKIESELSTSILRNMLAKPESLDELFFYEDNAVNNSEKRPEESELVKEWEAIKNNSTAPQSKSGVSTFDQKLISDFMAQSEARLGLGIDFEIKTLEHLLKDFLDKNPINTLRFPDKIIASLEAWKREEVHRGVTDERKSNNHKWIKLFLNFLSKKNIIVMPSFKDKINDVLKKIVKNAQDYKIVAPMIQLIFWISLFSLLSIFGNWLQPLNETFFGIALIDSFLCAGWLQKGIVTAPIFLLYLLSNHPIKGNILAKYACSWIVSVFLVLMSIPSYNLKNIFIAIISCIVLSILYRKSIDIISDTEKFLNLSLVSIWIIFCISSSFLPNLNIIPLLIFSSIFLFYCLLYRKINKDEIMLMSSQITGSSTNLEISVYKKVVSVDGNIKSVPHIYALIFSYLISFFISYIPQPYNKYNIYITILSYLMVLLLLARETIRNMLSIPLWKQKLNNRRQIIIDKNEQDNVVELETEKVLVNIKKKLLKKEILLQTTVLILCVVVLKDYQLYESQYPLGLIVLFLAFLSGEHILKFIEQLKHLLIFSGRITNETLDFSEVREPEEDKTFMQKIKDFFNPFKKTRRFFAYIISTLFSVAVSGCKDLLYNFARIAYDFLFK